MAETAPVAWLTGATGTWGGAFGRALLETGHDVVALGRREPAALAAAAASLGRRIAFVPLDLADPIPSGDAIAARLPAGSAPVPDVLVHAAVSVEGDRTRLARVDYLGPAELVEAVAASMVARGAGRIAVLLPQNARLGLRGAGDIAAPQGALWTWAEAFRGVLSERCRDVTLTIVVPPRAASATQRRLAELTGHSARLHEPDARALLRAVLAGRRRAGRRPLLAAAALALR